MNIIMTPANFGINDYHDNWDGSIAPTGYSFLKALSEQDLELDAIVQSIRLRGPQLGSNIRLHEVGWNYFRKIQRSFQLSQRLMRENNYDVMMQSFIFYGNGFNPNILAIRDHPFLLAMCESPHQIMKDETPIPLNSILKRLGRNYLTKKVVKEIVWELFTYTVDHCDALVAVNEQTRESYARIMPRSKISVIPHGVDNDWFIPSPLPHNHRILMVGRLIERRNINQMLRAMPSILREFPDTELHIAGGGEPNELLREAKSLKISPSLHYHGQVKGDKLADLYMDSYVICQLSNHEGWPHSVLEAMACGRPVICKDERFNAMVSEKTGCKLKFGGLDNLGDVVCDLFADRDKAQSMGHEARVVVGQEYNWGDIGKRYAAILRRVV